MIATTPTIIRALALGAAACSLSPVAAATGAASDAQPEQASDDDAAEDDVRPRSKAASSWQLDPGLRVTARGIAARSTAPAEDEVIDGNALAVLITPSLVLTKQDVTVTLRNSTTRLEFEDPARSDRWQNMARAAIRYDLSQATGITAYGERSDNMLAAEFASADETKFGAEIEHSFDAANRIQLGASWRERDYDDATRSSARGPRFDGEYRYRFGANHYAFLRGRHDRLTSPDNTQRNLARWVAEASYQRPIAKDLRLRSELSFERLEFSGRVVPGSGARRDDLFWPELTLIWSPGAWRIAGEARYVVRSSNDPAFDRSGYRFELEVSHAF